MWATIAIIFIVVLAAFFLGIFFIARGLARRVGDSVEKVPEQIVKETFTIIKDKIKKSDETRISNTGHGNS